MSKKSLSSMYREIHTDNFPPKMEIAFVEEDGNRQTMFYEKVEWTVEGEKRGLRYGENPDQEAALYRLTNGNLVLGDVETVSPGRYLASNVELLQSGKHPGKINITDADSALNILRYFSTQPCTVIIKHNNPCGVALGLTLAESYERAYLADRVAAFGGAVAVNRPVDLETAERISESYSEVVVAPEFEEGVIKLLERRKNLRIMRIANMDKLSEFVGKRFVDFKSLLDGGIVAQWSYAPKRFLPEELLPAQTEYKGQTYGIKRPPTDQERQDMIFGWLVEAGVTSNSVLFVRDGITVGIGTGEQDRVGVAEIARDKAYRKMADRISWLRYETPYGLLEDKDRKAAIDLEVKENNGGLRGSIMVSDGFFPFRDGIDIGLNEGVTAVIQPGGSIRDFESVEACNEHDATMVFTGQRSFRH